MSPLPKRRIILLSSRQRRPRKRRALRRTENHLAALQAREQRLPSGFKSALEMERLNAQERENAAARKETRGARAGGDTQVLFKDGAQPGFFLGVDFRESDEIAMEDLVGFAAEDIGQAAGHARAEIEAERAEDEDNAASHVFAAVLADAFDNGQGPAIADGEAFASAARDEKLAGGGAVENCVASEDIATAGGSRAGGYGDGASGKAFADVIVGFARER